MLGSGRTVWCCLLKYATTRSSVAIAMLVLATSTQLLAGESMRLASDPGLSPDGTKLAFAYAGDIWIVPTAGGMATRFSSHPAEESTPHFSPDGKRLAFTSNRTGTSQVFVAPIDGGTPTQVTFHAAGSRLEGWYPDGEQILVSGTRDHFWRRPSRFFKVALSNRAAEELLFDAYGSAPNLSSTGKRVLFQREGVSWWRKGYVGSQAAQIWLFDAEDYRFEALLRGPIEHRTPIWKPDGTGFYYVGAESGSLNLREYDFESKETKTLTEFDDDSVVYPTVSSDGSTIVFRHLFDFYRLKPGGRPEKIEITPSGDPVADPELRRTVTSVDDASFTPDGLEIAVAAGGDIWVMDTELREPVNVTQSAEWSSEPLFIEGGKALLFLKERDGATDLWKAEPADPQKYWWQQGEFKLTQLTKDPSTIVNLAASPDGKRIAFVRKPGELIVANLEAKTQVTVAKGFNVPNYDFSPDGHWIAFSRYDDDFNSEIWIVPSDGSAEPINVTRHPRNDSDPAWSPDGKILAFTGEREADEVDIYYVYLRREDDTRTERDRTLAKALEKLDKAREKPERKGDGTKEVEDSDTEKVNGKPPVEAEKPKRLEIDFEEIDDRIRRVRISGSRESGLFWFGDSKTLAFRASIDGKFGTYAVELPESKTPKLLTSDTGSFVGRLKDEKLIGWVSSDRPGTLSSDGKTTSAAFRANQSLDRAARFRAGFDVAWRLMRDDWYDEKLGNRNWDAIRRKYSDLAAAAPDESAFAEVVQMMLGELNGSHLGFSVRTSSRYTPSGWSPEAAHLGVRFEEGYLGPGLKIRDVLKNGPADRDASRLQAGEIIISVEGTTVDPGYDLSQILDGPLDRNISLRVRDGNGIERDVVLRPISYSQAVRLLYPMWIDANAAHVERSSAGRFGYLHIEKMNNDSLQEFERKLYDVGYGRDGLVIDVRENGGGSTADLLLTALTQPRHAITVPRGGGPGYPLDRTVYATWHKPIVVLCNQNSFSNAEIFSHAIKTLGRGRLVGVQTAGGVVSTGSSSVMDLGTLRKPFRGWFVIDTGEDMELNGANPHLEIWPEPGELPAGNDRQLEAAIGVLEEDVKAFQAKPRPALIKATEREAG